MRNSRLWISILVAGLIGACGQKGPLVLPDAPRHKKVAPSPRVPAAPAPESPSATPAPATTPSAGAADRPPGDTQKH